MPSPTTLPDITPANLDDYVICLMRNKTNGFEDIINTDKPAHMALQRAGAIMDEPPGIGPNRNVKFVQSRRAQFMSRTQTTVAKDFAETHFLTQAQYEYGMWVVRMTIAKFTFDMTQTPLARWNYVNAQMDNLEEDLVLTYNDVLWNGVTIGSTRIFGINDYVQFTPTSDPAGGAIGRLSVANFSQWKNQTANYNGPLQAMVGGGRYQTMLSTGTNSLSSVFRAASNHKNNGTSGRPDVMLVNEPYMLACEQLMVDGLLAQSPSSTNQLGVDGFKYKGMDIVWDENVPDDPNDSSYGVGIGLNCKKGFQVVYPTGLRRQVGEKEKHPTMEGYSWPVYVAMATASAHRGLNFVHYGIKPATAS